MRSGKQMKEWLKNITEDQNLDTLTQIESTPWDNLRNWFRRGDIQPVVSVGYYNNNTGYPVVGLQSPMPGSAYSSTSSSSYTLTVPAHRRYRVYYAAARNETQASTVDLSYVIGDADLSGNVAHISQANQQTSFNAVVGGMIEDLSATLNSSAMPKELWLGPGDSITLNLNTYAAGNTVKYIILYEEYRA